MEVKVLQRPARGRPRAWRNLPAPSPGAGVRYGVVFLIILTLLIFELVAPAGSLERAIAVALAGAAFIVAVATGEPAPPYVGS